MATDGIVTEPMRPEFSSTTRTRSEAIPGRSSTARSKGHSLGQNVLIGRRFEPQPEGLSFHVGVQAGVVALNEEDVELVHPAAPMLLHLQVAGRDVQPHRGAAAAGLNVCA